MQQPNVLRLHMLPSLDLLTVVILSRDRRSELQKTINYYGLNSISTIVLHKTQDPFKKSDLPKNCRYFSSQLSYAERCSLVPKLLDTPYAILATDDERYLPLSLQAMLLQLKKQKNHGSVGGINLAIAKYGWLCTATPTFTYLKNYKNYQDSFYARATLHFDQSKNGVRVGAMYRMYAANNFEKLMVSFSLCDDISTPYIFECIAEISSLSFGPIKYIPNLYWLRNWINQMASYTDWNRGNSFTHWWMNPLNQNRVMKLKNDLLSNLEIQPSELDYSIQLILRNRIESDSKNIKQAKKLVLNDNIKLIIRIFTGLHNLPPKFQQALKELKNEGIEFSNHEVRLAIKSMLKSN